jgi:hypothetical protein
MGVAADQARDHVIGEIARHRKLASVERGVAQAGDAVLGLDLQGDEIAPRAGNDDLGGNDLEHQQLPANERFMTA